MNNQKIIEKIKKLFALAANEGQECGKGLNPGARVGGSQARLN